MRVAALAPLAAMLVAVANAAPVPEADPFFCFFGWGPGCDAPVTTSSVKASSTSIAAVKTTIASTTIKSSSSSSAVPTSTKASSTLASATKAAATQSSIANWTWLWDPTYIFNMWNNFNSFRWDRYNDCSFNGYSLTYVKAWYYQTYGFKPLNGCQWIQVHEFLAKYAVKTSIAPASTQKYTPGCANPFGGADFNWRPTSSSSLVSSSKATSTVVTSKASSSSVQASSAAVTSKASSVSVVVASQAASSQVASSQVASSQVASSQVASSQAASSQVAASQAASSQATGSAVQSSVVTSSSQSSAAQSSSASSVDSAPVAQATDSTNSASASGAGANDGGSATDLASPTSTDSAASTPTVVTNYGIQGTPRTLSNGKTVQDLGCVAEVDGRKFKSASIDSPDVMTNEWCSNWCSNLGYPISGTEYAKECYCATASAMNSWVASDQCVMPCSADSSETCGGPQAIDVLYNPDAVRTVSLPTNWSEKGCYQDNSSRVLTYQAWSGKSDSTLESCSAQCASLGYTIAGAEYGSECFCGNDFVGGAVAIDSGSCNMPCPGNGGSQCGGSFALTVASSKSF